MSDLSRARFAEVARREPVDLGLACLLVAQDLDPGVEPGRWLAALDDLAARVPAAGDPVERLRAVLGGFGTQPEDYDDLRSSLLHEVLRRRRGLPILVAVVWLEVARRAGVPAHGVGLPGHFVVAVGEPGAAVLVDVAAGGRVLEGAGPAGRHRPYGDVETLARVLANVQRWAGRLDRLPQRLRAVELALLLPRHPAALRQERGRLRVRLGDVLGGAAELEDYADAVEAADPGAAGAARRAARLARATLN